MITLQKQERSNGDVTSTLLVRKNGRASSPTIFSKNFAAGSVLSILIDTVYFTLPKNVFDFFIQAIYIIQNLVSSNKKLPFYLNALFKDRLFNILNPSL